MTDVEKIAIVIGVIVIGALVIFKRPLDIIAPSQGDNADDVPAYLGAAQMPAFAFAPAIGNILPYTSNGTVGQDSATTDAVNARNYAGACGCGLM